MKLKKFVLLILVSLTFSCTTYDYGSKVVKEENRAGGKVSYKSYEWMKQDLKKKAETQMWSESKLRRRIKSVPQGGYIIIEIYSYTLEGANTKNWLYIIKNIDGKEIKRVHGKDDIGDQTSISMSKNSGMDWKNISVIPINKKINKPFEIYVIDKIMNRRSKFKIYPNKKNEDYLDQ